MNRNTDEMKLWLFDISHGNLTDTDILKGFIKYYINYQEFPMAYCFVLFLDNSIFISSKYPQCYKTVFTTTELSTLFTFSTAVFSPKSP